MVSGGGEATRWVVLVFGFWFAVKGVMGVWGRGRTMIELRVWDEEIS